MKAQLLTVASAWGSRVVSAAAQLIAVRYAMEKLGQDGFGAFALLGALLPWAMLFEFGIGYGLQNYISESRANGRAYRYLITHTTAAILSISFVLSVLAVFASPKIAEIYLKSVVVLNAEDKETATVLALVIFLWTTASGVYYKILFAEHKGWIANIIPAIGAIVGLVLLKLVRIDGHGNVLTAVIASYYLPNAILGILVAFFVLRVHRKAKPSMLVENSLDQRVKAIDFVRRAASFWGFAVCAALVLQVDYWVISQKLTAEDVVTYTIVFKIFSLALFVYTAVLQAMWPVFSENMASKNWHLVNQLIFKNISAGTALAITFCLTFLLFKEDILDFMKTTHEIANSTIILFSVYLLVRVWSDTFATVLQSANIMRPFFFLVPTQATLGLITQWILTDSYGINGVVIGLIAAFSFTVVPGLWFIYRNFVRAGCVKSGNA